MLNIRSSLYLESFSLFPTVTDYLAPITLRGVTNLFTLSLGVSVYVG